MEEVQRVADGVNPTTLRVLTSTMPRYALVLYWSRVTLQPLPREPAGNADVSRSPSFSEWR